MEPVINTDLGVISHKHCLPFRPSPQEQRVRALVARVSMAIDLRGLPFGRAATVSDVLTPKVRREPFNEDVNPSHLEVIDCWKGLSHTQATELTIWYQFLHKCLHNEVRAGLREEVVKDLLESEETIDEVYLIARILDCLRGQAQRIVDVSFVDLIDNMMGMFHDQFPNEAALVSSNWSHFSGGLSLFLHNFLRLQDCFRHSAHGPCLEVKFDFQYADSLLTATGDVIWRSPNVRFLHVPITRAPGELYRITPFIWKELDSPISSSDCDEYADQVDYTISRSTLSFSWDPAKRCFKAAVPHFPDDKPHTVETVVRVTVITPLPDDVKFERHSRWSIKLDITPAKSDHQTITQGRGIRRVYYPARNTLEYALNTDIRGSQHGTALQHVHRNEIASQPPQKRKVSKPEIVGAAVAPKRRRRDWASDVGDVFASENELSAEDCTVCSADPFMESAQQQVARRSANDAHADDACTEATQPSITKYRITSLHQSVPAWAEDLDQCDIGTSSISTSPANSEDSASSNGAIATDHDALQQQEILQNYHEFADRKLFKDAGLISPISDGERRVYESIFVGNSDEWSPATDGSAVAMDTVMGEK